MKTIKILHMYPDLLNLYGDKGNIAALSNRLKWRGIDAEVKYVNPGDDVCLDDVDIVFLGGGSDREEEAVRKELLKIKDKLTEYVEDNGVLLAVCGGVQMLGKYIKTEKGEEECLGICDFCTETEKQRQIGNVVLETELFAEKIVGFVNHYGRIKGSHSPLGMLINGEKEGVLYKNVFGTYLHGPLLPKNPALCDCILERALEKKYADFDGLEPLDDELENLANGYIVNNYTSK